MALFAAAPPDGIPGSNLFIDNCHPNRRGHQLLAEHLARLIREVIPTDAAGSSSK